ncbi:nickel-responsive transcriptional regulator NikR [Insolitispirillum peregrinum]|uniref:nickel-responsive transcriptional regulator NikR n=1 Tax=Insolitispirillum peregrinum TaxID=80876 RepID=UPI003613C351
MDRFTVSLDEDLLAQFDQYSQRRGYSNRSEAVRDILRQTLEAERLGEAGDGDCIACLSYIYNHHERELSRRLTQVSHAHHDLTHTTLHVHLDHDNCMEVVVLQGQTAAVRQFADAVTAETGVRHGSLHAVPVERQVSEDHHHHDHPGHDFPHVHHRPKT